MTADHLFVILVTPTGSVEMSSRDDTANIKPVVDTACAYWNKPLSTASTGLSCQTADYPPLMVWEEELLQNPNE